MLRSVILVLFLVASLWAKVNLNTADVSELSTLKGIGEKKAEAIISYRDANGGFKSIDELTNVKGIGEKTLASLKEELALQ